MIITNPQQNLTDLSKVKVEARALTTIKTFIIEGDCELSPLLKKNVNEWVVCLVVRNEHDYGQDSSVGSQSLHGNFYEHGNNKNFTQ